MSTYYTSKYSGEQIDEAVGKMLEGGMTGDYADRQLSNLDTPQAALSNLGAGVRPNLLVNPRFQVNQRSQTSYSGTYGVYTVDGWLLNNAGAATVNVLSDGVQIVAGTTTAQFRQYLESLSDGVYTLSFLFTDGSLGYAVYEKSGTAYTRKDYAGSDVWGLGMQDTGGKPTAFAYVQAGMSAAPIASKLESGEGQTLAYQDEDGAWQLLPQPESDYATQLLKCQRYLDAMENQTIVRSAYVSTNFVDFLVPIPVSFRVLPIIQSAEKLVLIIQPDGAKVSGVTWSIATKSSASVRLRASKPNILSEGTDFSVYTDQGATFFSAEL